MAQLPSLALCRHVRQSYPSPFSYEYHEPGWVIPGLTVTPKRLGQSVLLDASDQSLRLIGACHYSSFIRAPLPLLFFSFASLFPLLLHPSPWWCHSPRPSTLLRGALF